MGLGGGGHRNAVIYKLRASVPRRENPGTISFDPTTEPYECLGEMRVYKPKPGADVILGKWLRSADPHGSHRISRYGRLAVGKATPWSIDGTWGTPVFQSMKASEAH